MINVDSNLIWSDIMLAVSALDFSLAAHFGSPINFSLCVTI